MWNVMKRRFYGLLCREICSRDLVDSSAQNRLHRPLDMPLVGSWQRITGWKYRNRLAEFRQLSSGDPVEDFVRAPEY
jgi:hypothetical protein